MQNLIYWVFAGVLVVTVVAAVAVGGWMWIAPVLAVVLTAAYAVADRRMKARQSPEERLMSEIDPE
jgi:hypothetical protein